MCWLWFGLGGAAGTLIRYGISLGAPKIFGATFPAATLIVNLVGSFLMCAIMQVATTTEMISPTTRLALTTGVMGGLTTYSTFNYDVIQLARGGSWALCVTYATVTFAGCLIAGLLGLAAGRMIAGT